jgi:hypothetical protein
MGFKQTTTVSSDGLSASLLETPNDFIGDEVRTMDFFLDVNLLYDLIGVSLEEANSHLVMFEITGEDLPTWKFDFSFLENDPELRRATILDGRLINFLFSNSVTKAVRGIISFTHSLVPELII